MTSGAGLNATTMVARGIGLLAALACLFAAVHSSAEQRRRSVSIGNSNDGRLEQGVRLPDRGPGFLAIGGVNNDARWGTDELIEAIETIGAGVERGAPGAALIIGDLGFREGGEIPHHESHQAGRDADLLFYMTDKAGAAIRSRALRFDAVGKSRSAEGDEVRFDAARNWLVLRSLVENREASLQRVFVAEHLRALLLAHAEAAGEPPWIIERAGEAMCEPAVPHDDHFHIRLFCTADDYRRGCRDTWPIFPWRRTELAPLGLTDLETAPPRPRKASWRRRYKRRVTPGRVWCP
jgi:penicillin-insensitive murein endopeptidase